SYASEPSLTYGVNSPSESPRPRTSCTTTTYPRRFHGSDSLETIGWFLLYGVRVSTAGNGPSPAGKYRSVARRAPSRAATVTLYLRFEAESTRRSEHDTRPSRHHGFTARMCRKSGIRCHLR